MSYPPQGAAPGITKLSELEIDVDKNWGDHTLTNVKDAVAAGQPLTIEQMMALVAYAWTGAAGEKVRALVQDADYIYAGFYTAPGKVIKIAKATMATADTWTAPVGENYCVCLTQDDDNIYFAAYLSTPAKVNKITKATMATAATWTAGAGENNCHALAQDTTYVYAGISTDPTQVKKITKATMTTSATWTGAVGEKNVRALTQDTDYVYAGFDITPAKVIKITKATMATSATWTGGAGETECYGLTQDTDYVYAGLSTDPAKVIKITKATMATSKTWTGESDMVYAVCIVVDDDFVHVGFAGGAVARVVKLEKGSLKLATTWRTGGAGERNCDALTQDADYIYVGLNIDPGKVIKIDNRRYYPRFV